MNTTVFIKKSIMGILILGCLPDIIMAQPALIPHYKKPFFLDSGVHIGYMTNPFVAFSQVIRVPNVPWLRLHFSDYNLGAQSYITITSLEDGGQQRLDAESLSQWRKSSAFFNGDAVELKLYVAPEERGIFIRVEEITVGERFGQAFNKTNIELEPHHVIQPGKLFSICDATDGRVASNDLAVGRVTEINAQGDTIAQCTGWITSNGAHLTAGHCTGVLDILEFNVPKSDSNGTPNFAHPDSQYSVIAGSIRNHNAGRGDDWAVFNCSPNSNTGLLPVHAQGAFYRMTRDSVTVTSRITGYGVDGPPPNFGNPPPRNSDSQTQQTATGPYVNEVTNGPSNVYHQYRVDTQGGNSGSPIILDGTNLTIGIHTHGGCTSTGGANAGTSFENDSLENAIQTFPGQNVKYVDNGHPIDLEDGTVFRPYDTVTEGVNSVLAGGILSIVAGSYSDVITINKAMTVTAPVGTATIGTSTLASMLIAASTPAKPATPHTEDEENSKSIISEFSLSQNYPNPFNPETTIEYTLPKPAFVKLKVYNLFGQEVRTLVNEFQQTGVKLVVWDGKDNLRLAVTSGVYICRIEADEFTKSSRLLLVK